MDNARSSQHFFFMCQTDVSLFQIVVWLCSAVFVCVCCARRSIVPLFLRTFPLTRASWQWAQQMLILAPVLRSSIHCLASGWKISTWMQTPVRSTINFCTSTTDEMSSLQLLSPLRLFPKVSSVRPLWSTEKWHPATNSSPRRLMEEDCSAALKFLSKCWMWMIIHPLSPLIITWLVCMRTPPPRHCLPDCKPVTLMKVSCFDVLVLYVGQWALKQTPLNAGLRHLVTTLSQIKHASKPVGVHELLLFSAGLNRTVVYSLVDEVSGFFSIDPVSGMVILEKSLDRESRDSYNVRVQAADQAGQQGALSTQVGVHSDTHSILVVFFH